MLYDQYCAYFLVILILIRSQLEPLLNLFSAYII